MNVLLTGVSRGLGLKMAEVLLANNWTVYGLSRSKSKPLDWLIEKYPDHFKWKQYDLCDAEKVRTKLFKEWIGYATPIHAYINNAASAYDDIVTNLDIDKLESMYWINVFTPMNITKYVIRQMLLHQVKGSILHISSISVHTGYKGLAMYGSTKGALEAFSKNTAREWGGHGIRSNCLVAGFMETDMSSTLSAEQRNKIFKRTSLKQPVCMASVAETVAFLIADKSASITGENIHVDAGTI